MLWIYSTAPVGAVVGCVQVNVIEKFSLDVVKTDDVYKYADPACVLGIEFMDYYLPRKTASGRKPKDEGVAIWLLNPRKLDQPIPLAKLREMRAKFNPPQEWIYLTDGEVKFLEQANG